MRAIKFKLSHSVIRARFSAPFSDSGGALFSSIAAGEGGDEKDLLKDNLMRDIQDGFRQRRLPDGGFKVRQTQKERGRSLIYGPRRPRH